MPESSSRELELETRPPALERRLVLRLLAHWRHMCGERLFPSVVQINPDEFDDMWAWCFTIDVAGNREDPVLRAVGTAMARLHTVPLANLALSALPPRTLIAQATEYWREAVTRRVPVSRGGQFAQDDGATILFRSILLPMSEDGETVGALLGAGSCRQIVGL